MNQADRSKVPASFWQGVKMLGLEPAALLRAARLPQTLHISEKAMVTTAQYFALMRALENLTGDNALGIKMVQAADTMTLPPSSLSAFFARDYRDGLDRLVRFKRLCTPEKISLTEKGDSVEITTEWIYAGEPEPALVTDIAFAFLVELGRRGSGQHIVPRQVEYAYAHPDNKMHRDYFGCPVKHGTGRNLLILNRRDLDLPFPGHNHDLLEMMTTALSSAVDEIQAHNNVCEQVKLLLKRGLASGRPDLAGIAHNMGMSERTLQRRITEEGSSFREILTQARRELGQHLLADPETDVDEIAFLLGYQDSSSFYRAFRDWEGVTPSQWRDAHIHQGQLGEASLH